MKNLPLISKTFIVSCLKKGKYAGFFLLFPYLVDYTPDDTSYTDLSFGLGGGRYRHVDCNDSYNKTYGDAGVQFITKSQKPFRYGLSFGIGTNYFFAYPVLGFDWNTFAVGTTGIRVGSSDQIYIELGLGNQIPFGSGKGMENLGVGFVPGGPLSRFWIGATGSYPYRSVGIGIQPEFRLGERHFLFFNSRYGEYHGNPEFGASIGLRIRSF